jgi:hypothetical protein
MSGAAMSGAAMSGAAITRWLPGLVVAVLLLTLPVLAGCGGGAPSGGGGSGGGDGGVKQYLPAQLPKVEQQLPPLDGGRIELPTPDGWAFAAQGKGLVTRFHLKGRTGIPQIVVKAEDAAGGIATVTAANVVEYADQVQAELDAQVAQKRATVLEPARPLLLGNQAWARYVLSAKLPNKVKATIERQVLRTTQSGRTFTIDLQVNNTELSKHRDHAYAIAASTRFHAGEPGKAAGQPSDVAAPGETKSTETESTETESTETESTETESTETESTETESTETESTETESTETESAETESAETESAESPATSTSR